jgi:catechol 2,3-dioxygenase-like lactoylglutathione lyase family enzyme
MDGSKIATNVLKAHVALNVEDTGKSIDFYRVLFDLEPAKVRDGYAKFDVVVPPLNLSLNRARAKETGRLSHLGIQVASTEDVVKMRDRLTAAGLETRDEMQTNCCYALQDKTWVRDPDGNEWEVFAVLEDNLTESDACCGTSDKIDVEWDSMANFQ